MSMKDPWRNPDGSSRSVEEAMRIIAEQEVAKRNPEVSAMPTTETISRVRASAHSALRPTDAVSDDIKHIHARMLEALRKFGTVVYMLQPKDPDRLCVCFKNVHGGHGIIEDAVCTPSYGFDFMKHQNAFFHALRTATDLIPASRAKLFLEATVRNGYENQDLAALRHSYTPDQVLQTNATAELVARDPAACSRMFSYLRGQFGDEADAALDSHCGDMRFLCTTLAQGVDWSDRVYSMSSSERERTFAEKGSMSLEEYTIKDYNNTHAALSLALTRSLRPNDVGIVVLGGGHFRQGSRGESQEQMYRQLRDRSVFVEDHIERNEQMSNTSIVVFEPAHYDDLVA